jgi:type I restriction enzyme S subunit
MSLPRYPEYKPSGVEWLGEVPGHWDVIRLKNVLQQRITDGPHTTPAFVDDGVP